MHTSAAACMISKPRNKHQNKRSELHLAKQMREKKRQIPVHRSLLSKSLADNQFACCHACKRAITCRYPGRVKAFQKTPCHLANLEGELGSVGRA